jgi:hypothetical protein
MKRKSLPSFGCTIKSAYCQALLRRIAEGRPLQILPALTFITIQSTSLACPPLKICECVDPVIGLGSTLSISPTPALRIFSLNSFKERLYFNTVLFFIYIRLLSKPSELCFGSVGSVLECSCTRCTLRF